MEHDLRRNFMIRLAQASGGLVLAPVVTACSSKAKRPCAPTGTVVPATAPSEATSGGDSAAPSTEANLLPAVALATPPLTPPSDWDPIAYNRERGNIGAIPESYHESINGPDGVKSHLGKHLPYRPKLSPELTPPSGYIALMWGDPSKGYVRHPNAPRNESNQNQGHWYNWIRIRKATSSYAQELQSGYSNWPATVPGDTGSYKAFGGGDIKADSGKNTIYLAALPEDVKPGDTIRIWAHCLTHGEYVDFLRV